MFTIIISFFSGYWLGSKEYRKENDILIQLLNGRKEK